MEDKQADKDVTSIGRIPCQAKDRILRMTSEEANRNQFLQYFHTWVVD
jgi:hypothetical protein